MPTITWPASPSNFPQYFLQGSVTGGPEDNTIRTQVAVGRQRVRQRYATPTQKFSGALLFPDQTAFQAFENFFYTTLSNGTAEFDWVHPLKPSVAATLRFVGQFTAQPQTNAVIRVTCNVEVLP